MLSRSMLALSCIVLASVPLRAQEAAPVGRWVDTDPVPVELLVFFFEPGGAVHRLMPAPQFQATYHVEGNELTLNTDDAPPASMTLRGDTLAIDGTSAYVRMADPPEAGGFGTWRYIVEDDMERFMTLRSDGQVVLEVGFSAEASFRRDTLRLDFSQGPRSTFVLRQTGDTLRVLDLESGEEGRFVRLPWGCFGLAVYDERAPECHP